MKHIYLASVIAFFFVLNLKAQLPASLDDLPLAWESYWKGEDGSGFFKSSNATFYNSFTDMGAYSFWSGFAYSNTTDTSTGDFSNESSAIPGQGYGGSANYAVAYASPEAWIEFDNMQPVRGFYATNSTYVYHSLKNGDAFSKKFGGETGEDPDFFKLSIEGVNDAGVVTDTVEFYLADFRFESTDQDYIVDQWLWVDLSKLGNVKKLRFVPLSLKF